MAQHIFISYKHEDRDFAELLVQHVKNAGFEVWIDSDKDQLRPGDEWRITIDHGIKKAAALIVVVSPQSKASEYVTYEWAFAWGAGVTVIPVLYQKTSIHPRLEILQYLDFTQKERPWDALINTLQTIVATLRNYEQSIHLDSNQAVAYIYRGDALKELQRYDEALAAYEQATLLDPHNADFYHTKGVLLFKELKLYEKALAAYEQATHLDPGNAEYYSDKGDALLHLRRYDDALFAYEQAILLDPYKAEYYFSKGEALYESKQYEKALPAYEKAIELDPSKANYYYSQGDALLHLGRLVRALVAFEKAIELDPLNASYHSQKSHLLREKGERDSALSACEKAIELDPFRTKYYIQKGQLLQEMGRKEEAADCFIKASQL